MIYAHGFGCNKDMWSLVTPAFESSHRQIVFDYVGSGQSDLSAFDRTRYSNVRGYAMDILDVCDDQGLTSDVTFVGHSVSCSAGIVASLMRPGLFGKLILIGPSPCFLNHGSAYRGGFERADLDGLLDLMDANFIGWAAHLAPVVSGDPDDAATAKLQASFCSTDPDTAKVFARTTFFADDRESFAQVQTPSLILHHKYDALVPDTVADFMRAHVPNARFQVLDVHGHCAHMSHPDLVVSEMRSFLGDA